MNKITIEHRYRQINCPVSAHYLFKFTWFEISKDVGLEWRVRPLHQNFFSSLVMRLNQIHPEMLQNFWGCGSLCFFISDCYSLQTAIIQAAEMGYKQPNPKPQIRYLTEADKKFQASRKIPNGSLI